MEIFLGFASMWDYSVFKVLQCELDVETHPMCVVLVLQNVWLLLQSVGYSSRTSEILQGRTSVIHRLLPACGNCTDLGGNCSSLTCAICTLGMLVAHGTRCYSNPVKGQLGFILDDLHDGEILNLYLWAGEFCSLIPEFGILGQEGKWRENLCALEDSAVTLWSPFSE